MKSTFDLRMEHPFSCIVSGCSGSGKTTWVYKLLEHKQDLITPLINAVYYFYTQDQPQLFHTMKELGLVQRFIQGAPTTEKIRDISSPQANVLIIVDDNMKNVGEDMSEIFTTFRHRNVSAVFLTQNLFLQNKDYRTMSLNSNYIVIMKNPRDGSQIVNFAKQIRPKHTRFVTDSFRNATSDKPYSYLLFDLRQSTDERLRVRARIFPDEFPMHVYLHNEL